MHYPPPRPGTGRLDCPTATVIARGHRSPHPRAWIAATTAWTVACPLAEVQGGITVLPSFRRPHCPRWTEVTDIGAGRRWTDMMAGE